MPKQGSGHHDFCTARCLLSIQAMVFATLALVVLPQAAFAQVSPTTGAAISGSVLDADGKPVVDAHVTLAGPKVATTETDTRGQFDFISIPLGTYRLTVKAKTLGTAMRSILVDHDINVAIQYSPPVTGLKTIAHVSSARFNVTPASVTRINPSESAFAGNTSWRRILERIPGLSQTVGIAGSPSVFTAAPGSPFGAVQLSIDGALPYESAVLLDNMPLIGLVTNSGPSAAGTGTDLSYYPLNSFGYADIIRGPGATASIVDSVGGTFSLHSPGSVNQNQFDFSVFNDSFGGVVSNARLARRWGKLSAVVTYGINDSPGPEPGNGILATPVFYPTTVNGHAFRCINSCRAQLPSPYSSINFAVVGWTTNLLQGGMDQRASWSQHSGSIALNYAISPAVSAGFFYVGQSTSTSNLASQNIATDFVPPTGYAGAIQPGSHAFSEAGTYLGTSPYNNSASLTEEKFTASIGRGLLHLAALQNRTFANYTLTTASSLAGQLYGGGDICSDASAGCSSGTYVPTIFNGGTYNLRYGATVSQNNRSQANNRDLLASYAYPIGNNFSSGISFVNSYYDNPQWFGEIYGGSVIFPLYPAYTSSDESQTTNETRLFIGGDLSPHASLELAEYLVDVNYHVQDPNRLGARIDASYAYSAPRVGFVWKPTTALSFRASAGGGFAEAPLKDLIGSNGVPTCQVGDCFTTRPNLSLKPEKSFGVDLGAEVRLQQNTVLSFDIYHTNLYGQIFSSSQFEGSCPTCSGLPVYVTQYGNIGQSRMEGIVAAVRHDVAQGLDWSVSAGLTRGYVVSVPADFYDDGGTCNRATLQHCQNLSVVPNINYNGTFLAQVPYAQASGELGYRWSSVGFANLAATYYGNNNSYMRPAFAVLSAHAGYNLTHNVSLLLTLSNITGAYDGEVQTYSLANSVGAPTIAGPPVALFGQEYGPRAIQIGTNVRI